MTTFTEESAVVHKDHMAMGPTSLNVKWQAADFHEGFREQKKYCNCSLVTTHQMYESALALKDHLCKEPSSFGGKWQAKRIPQEDRINNCRLVTAPKAEPTKAL